MITYYKLVDDRTPQYTNIKEALGWIKKSRYSESIVYFRQQLSLNPLYSVVQYKEDRKKLLPAIQWNSNEELGSGFIYIDIDCASVGEAEEAKHFFTTGGWEDAVYACWFSASREGLGLLFKTDEILSKEDFLIVWQAIADNIAEGSKFGKKIDIKTKDFARVNFLSFDPNIFINEESLLDTKSAIAYQKEKELLGSKERKETIAEKQRKEFSNTLILQSQYGWRPKEYIKAKAKDAKHLELNLFASIKVGNRGNTYSAVATKLFRLNPQPEKLNEIKKVIVWLNNNRAEKPWDNTEIQHFVDNIEIHKKGKAVSSKKVVIKNPTYSELLNVFDQVNKINIKSMEQTIVNIVQRAEKELLINKAVKSGATTLNDIYKKTGISKTTITKYFNSQDKKYSEQLAISDVKDVVKQLNEFIHELIQANEEALAA